MWVNECLSCVSSSPPSFAASPPPGGTSMRAISHSFFKGPSGASSECIQEHDAMLLSSSRHVLGRAPFPVPTVCSCLAGPVVMTPHRYLGACKVLSGAHSGSTQIVPARLRFFPCVCTRIFSNPPHTVPSLPRTYPIVPFRSYATSCCSNPRVASFLCG